MDMTLHHPIVLAAIRAQGTTPGEIVTRDAWRALQTVTLREHGAAEGVPWVDVSRDKATVTWGAGCFEMVRDRSGGWLYEIRLWRMRMPEAMTATLEGRRLSEVVDVPGADKVTILSARTEDRFELQLSDPD